ncbi:hypothetical protein [Vibrio cholerae]|uniref:hypothetical protein n=1 Tax=Vibrio cholerae TaxID=666 RepID=UPI00226E2AD1|nr:hypothetical protein [Vibrio cholerae]
MSEKSENVHSFGGFFPEKRSDISKPKISMGVPFGTEIQETYQDLFSFDEKQRDEAIHRLCCVIVNPRRIGAKMQNKILR